MAKGRCNALLVFAYLSVALASDQASCLIQQGALVQPTLRLSPQQEQQQREQQQQQQKFVQQAQKDILIIGDSWGEMAGTILDHGCSGKTVVNRAVSGSTAKQWIGGLTTPGGASCNLTEAFSSTHGTGYGYVWLTVGGNDWMGTGCAMNAATLTNRIKSAIDKVQEAAAAAGSPNIQVVMTGYCTPREDVGKCKGVGLADVLQDSIKNAVAVSSNAQFIDSRYACGASASTYSPTLYFADNIHVNGKGYCKVFSQPSVQTAFGCASQSFACDDVDVTVPGVDGAEEVASVCDSCEGGCLYQDECYSTYEGDPVTKAMCGTYHGTWCPSDE